MTFISSVAGNAYGSIEKWTTSELENLSQEQWAEALHQLNWETGTQGLVNEKDLPVIIRKVNALAARSLKIRNALNEERVTLSFLESLANRFKSSVWEMAVTYDSVTSRKLLWQWVQTNGDLEAYEVIQKVHQIAEDCLREAKEQGLFIFYGNDNAYG